MKKISSRGAYSISNHKDGYLIGLTTQFAVFNSVSQKDCIGYTFPPTKNCCSLFFNDDGTKALILNTTGTGFLYDMVENKIIKNRIYFGKRLYTQCFTSCKDGFIYLNQDKEVCLFDTKRLVKEKLPNFPKYSRFFEDGNKVIFLEIIKKEEHPMLSYLGVRIFSKETNAFTDKAFSLPQGDLRNLKKIDDDRYSCCFEKSVKGLPREYICILNVKTEELTELVCEDDYYVNDDYFVDFDLDLEKGRLCVLYSQSLKLVDLKTMKLIQSKTSNFTSAVKITDEGVIVTTWTGIFFYEWDSDGFLH